MTTKWIARLVAGGAIAGGLTAAALVLGGTPGAGAAGSEVTVRAGVNAAKDPNIAVLEYLPGSVTVKTGSTVSFSWKGVIEPHSVTFLAPGQKYQTIDENVGLVAPTPPTGPYDGTTFVSSGLQPLGGAKPAPFALTFAKAGKYRFYCVIHPNMSGSVNVVDRGKSDTAAQVAARGKAEQKRWVAEGVAAKKKLDEHASISTESRDGSRTWTIQMGTTTKHADILAFAPTPKKIKVGDSVRFVNSSQAPHTATFAGEQEPITNPIGPQTEDPAPGPSPQTLNHTDLFNTGVLPQDAPIPPSTTPPPKRARTYQYRVKSTGRYAYYCILHTLSGMGGEIRAT